MRRSFTRKISAALVVQMPSFEVQIDQSVEAYLRATPDNLYGTVLTKLPGALQTHGFGRIQARKLREYFDRAVCHASRVRAAPPGLLQQCRFRSLSAGFCRLAPDLFAKAPPCEPNASAARCGYDFP